jgi:type IV pilus assembly protein PilA
MSKIQKGFTLIELMIVVAIIAILAAIALPAYQDYMVRAKLSEVVVTGDACKNSVVEFFEGQGHVPGNISSAGCADNKTKYIESTVVAGSNSDATIQITTTNLADLYDAKSTVYELASKAGVSPDVLEWSCNGTGTTIPKKYLPSLCR